MKSLTYPSKFVSEPEGGFSVRFIDLPEAHTQGDTRDEAFRMAIDCLHAAIEWRLEEKKEIPAPSRVKRGQTGIPVALDEVSMVEWDRR
jgi:antitoxin HicB